MTLTLTEVPKMLIEMILCDKLFFVYVISTEREAVIAVKTLGSELLAYDWIMMNYPEYKQRVIKIDVSNQKENL